MIPRGRLLPPFDLQAQVCIDASRNDCFLANRIVAESLLCCQRLAVPGWLGSGAALPSMARQQHTRSVIVGLLALRSSSRRKWRRAERQLSRLLNFSYGSRTCSPPAGAVVGLASVVAEWPSLFRVLPQRRSGSEVHLTAVREVEQRQVSVPADIRRPNPNGSRQSLAAVRPPLKCGFSVAGRRKCPGLLPVLWKQPRALYGFHVGHFELMAATQMIFSKLQGEVGASSCFHTRRSQGPPRDIQPPRATSLRVHSPA